jgi:acylglycerol lipase
MVHTTLPFATGTLHYHCQNTQQKTPVVALIHGMGEHTGRYTHVKQHLSNHGYSWAAIDLPGHGLSSGKRGHVANYDSLLAAIDVFIAQINTDFPNSKIYIWAHSMGGNIALNYLIRKAHNVAAAVITSPWLQNYGPVPKLELYLGKILQHIYPSLGIPTKLDANLVSRDAAVVQAYQADPLVHGNITPGWFFGALAAQQYAITHAANIHIPLLLMHGTSDMLAHVEGSQKFANNANKNLQLKLWEGLYHETHNEPEQISVLDYAVNFLNTITKDISQ